MNKILEAERQRIIRHFISLKVSTEGSRDEVIWLKDNLGLQSTCFLLLGEQWKGRGSQPVLDPKALLSRRYHTLV
jgi:hypothetical protein